MPCNAGDVHGERYDVAICFADFALERLNDRCPEGMDQVNTAEKKGEPEPWIKTKKEVGPLSEAYEKRSCISLFHEDRGIPSLNAILVRCNIILGFYGPFPV